jgi:2-polyprenyl-3-methyl-5-hydroxy-6-metoxy-1,4-benzoquinol methylase
MPQPGSLVNCENCIYSEVPRSLAALTDSRPTPILFAMDPHLFVAEVYRRMALRAADTRRVPPAQERIDEVAEEYRSFLPREKNAAILDIGFGDGWFMAACLKLGYTNISGAEYAPENKPYLKDWNVRLYKIETEIGEFLASHPAEYDFIHMSHVIEHIPKYSLLWIVDALYQSLKKGGTLLLRTPNMEGPCANSSYYVTLAHEYGFSGSNLRSLLSVCGFDDIRLHPPHAPRTPRQRFGALARWPYIQKSRIRDRLFGVNSGGQFGAELIATARRGDFPCFFDEKYR